MPHPMLNRKAFYRKTQLAALKADRTLPTHQSVGPQRIPQAWKPYQSTIILRWIKPKWQSVNSPTAKGLQWHIFRSKKRSGLTKKVWLGCAHAGKYRNWREYLTEETRKRKTCTRRSGCPWQATIHRKVLVKSSDSKTAEVEVDDGAENVPLGGEQEW
ncbi:hypothetical protein PsorP6_012673 [Peronosclerospora sorghi]|uniref:Uncharacterized protein n=1 Tax=Peronosclerospora sorghi TaxID=230839 RepID=A0ACC0WFF9_9STRA|nr:hypothetical protein PsorP6_012673 [Peronosclerospora sorghi]